MVHIRAKYGFYQLDYCKHWEKKKYAKTFLGIFKFSAFFVTYYRMPFDVTTTPGYEIGYLICVTAGYSVGLIAAVDSFLICACLFIAAAFDDLRCKLLLIDQPL